MRSLFFHALLVALTAVTAASLHVQAAEHESPQWPFQAEQTLGFIAFESPLAPVSPALLHQERQQAELKLQTITGEELLSRLKFIPFSYFQDLAPEKAEETYQSYLTQNAEKALAQLALEKILDHESLRRQPRLKNANEAPLMRLNYVLRTVLLSFHQANSPAGTPLPPTLELSPFFEELKQVVGTQPVRFNIDWKQCEGPLQFHCRQFKMEPAWPELVIEFKKFPHTLPELSTAIAEKLLKSAASLQRDQTWQRLLAERSADLGPRQVTFRMEEFQAEFKALPLDSFVLSSKFAGVNLSSFETAWKNPKMRDLLIERVKSSRLIERNRRLILQLFQENPFLEETPLCRNPEWICLRFEAETLARELAPQLKL